MARADGQKTKEKILQIAEQLFAEKGYDGTSVDVIAKKTGVNKALIYYHFKNKEDILNLLNERVMDELIKQVEYSMSAHERGEEKKKREGLSEILDFLLQKRRILSIMLMESLKQKDTKYSLFRCAEYFMHKTKTGDAKELHDRKEKEDGGKQQHMVYEFFTGFIPLILFAVLEEKWSNWFDCDREKLFDYFIDAFEKSHIRANQHTSDSKEE